MSTPASENSEPMTLKQVLEALLFASQKPLSPKEMTSALKATLEVLPEDESAIALAKSKPEDLQSALLEIQQDYNEGGRSFQLVEASSGWQVVSRPDFSEWVRQLYPENRPARLSGPALETLAIIAYRQPITRADIEAVRGVSVDGVMQTLMDRGLVKIAGRADVPGRPLLYETSGHFLEHFGLKELDELPNASELRTIKLPTAEASSEEEKVEQMELGGETAAAEPTAEAEGSAPHHDSGEGLGFEDEGDLTAGPDVSLGETDESGEEPVGEDNAEESAMDEVAVEMQTSSEEHPNEIDSDEPGRD